MKIKNLLFVSLALVTAAFGAGTGTVIKDPQTNDLKPIPGLTEAGFNVPSGATVQFKPGSILNLTGSTITGLNPTVADGDKGDIVISGGLWLLESTGITAGTYTNVTVTVDVKGRVTAISSGSGGVGVTDGDKGDVVVTGSGTTWNLDTTGITPGSYTNVNLTVDAKGRITVISNGSVGGVTSVNTRTGAVTLTSADVGLGSVDNTPDASKPVSTPQQTALNLKANASAVSNVDNTSDANKPVSTAQQTALNLKANAASPSFTGTKSDAAGLIITPVTLATLHQLKTSGVADNREANAGAVTLTLDNNTPTNGARFPAVLTNSGASANLYTLPSVTVYSVNHGTTITSFYIGAGNTEHLYWEYDSANSRFVVEGVPLPGQSTESAVTIASNTADLWQASTNLTIGAGTVNSFGANFPVGLHAHVKFTGAGTLTHNSSSMILPNAGSNITYASGDTLEAYPVTAGNWKVTRFTKADGTSLVGGGGTGTANTFSVTQTSHGFTVKQAVYFNGTTWLLSKADALVTSKVHGVVSTVTDANNFIITQSGAFTTSGWTANTVYYLSDATAGLLTTTAPSTTTSFLVTVATTGSATQAFVQISNPASLSLLQVADGGTGASTAYGAFDALSVHGADVASAGTLNLDTATGNLVDVTGTTTITAITLANGLSRTIRFTGALTLTSNSSIIIPGSANVTTAAGDIAMLRGYAAGVVRVVAYTRANGTALVGSGATPTGTGFVHITAGAQDAAAINPDSISRVVTSTSHGLTVGTLYAMWNSTGTTWVKASASSSGLGRVSGIAQPIDANTFTLITSGNITTTGLTAGSQYYLTDDASGTLTTTAPTTLTSFLVPLLVSGSTTNATVAIGQPASLQKIGTNDINFGLTADTSTSLTVTTAMDYITTSNASPVTANLPTLAAALAANPTKIYHFKNLGAGDLTITPNGAETIFIGSASQSTAQLRTGDAYVLVATATQWLLE